MKTMTTLAAHESASRLGHYFTAEEEILPMAPVTGFAGLVARFTALRERLAARRNRNTALAELARLSDHELSDIGLVRSDLLRINDPNFVAAHNAARSSASVYGLRSALIRS